MSSFFVENAKFRLCLPKDPTAFLGYESALSVLNPVAGDATSSSVVLIRCCPSLMG